MPEPDYVVIRGTASRQDGKWYDRANFIPPPPGWSEHTIPDEDVIVLTPTGMIEVREDGAIAEVWAPKKWRVSDDL